MIQYAFIKVGIPQLSDANKRSAFLSHVCFQLGGGDVFSFADLKHGILRNNRKASSGLAPFSNNNNKDCSIIGSSTTRDRLLGLCMTHVDPRIHFALSCGGKSCPFPVYWFHGEAIEEELQAAGQQFCDKDSNVQVDEVYNTVYLASVFQWYKDDFLDPNASTAMTMTTPVPSRTSSTTSFSSNGTGGTILEYVLGLLSRGKKRTVLTRMLQMARDGDRPAIKVQYNPYDGTLASCCKASDFQPFTLNGIKADVGRLMPNSERRKIG
jgi:Protein of unknown function, DUF547